MVVCCNWADFSLTLFLHVRLQCPIHFLVPLNSLVARSRVEASDKEAFWTFICLFLHPSCCFQLPLLSRKAILKPRLLLLTLPPSFSILSHFPQILAPRLPLTLMPPSLSLPSSDPPPLVLQSTSFHSVLAPHHSVFPPAPPLATRTNSALTASASPSLHYSHCWYWQWRILSICLTLSIHPPCSHTSTQLKLFGALFQVLKTSSLQRDFLFQIWCSDMHTEYTMTLL